MVTLGGNMKKHQKVRNELIIIEKAIEFKDKGGYDKPITLGDLIEIFDDMNLFDWSSPRFTIDKIYGIKRKSFTERMQEDE